MGQKLTLKEQMRRNQRVLKKAIRDVDREKTKLEKQQKKLVSDIKKLAKQGQMVSQTRRCYLLFRPIICYDAACCEVR
jgi:charged multivesicular body protein 2A